MRVLLLALVATCGAVFIANIKPETYSVKFISYDGGRRCELLNSGSTQMHRRAMETDSTVIEMMPLIREEGDHDEVDGEQAGEEMPMIVEAFSPRETDVMAVLKNRCQHVKDSRIDTSANQLNATEGVNEVFRFRNTGPSANRIDVVLMGDGYTATQRQAFIDDMNRLVDEMFVGETFGPWLPVFNIWGIYRASVETGIGTHGRPRNTAFGLYRQGTELRGVFTARPQDARQACTLTGPGGCDFPSLIGNDDFYGGLGGEFTISTRSILSGTVVLRHEMGHNFINVGEEYDGGQVYRGVNFSPNLNVPWRHWLTDQTTWPARAQDSRLAAQAYPWTDLARGVYSVRFTSDGQWNRWFLRFTVSGCDSDNALEVAINGVPLPWRSQGSIDRQFYDFQDRLSGFPAGTHTLTFRQVTPPAPGRPIRQICSLTLHEYKNEPGFVWDNEYVGAYRTWRQGNSLAGYRPNNEKCLMRNMSSTHFCKPCGEGMWLRFLNRMELLDGVDITGTTQVRVRAMLVPLGQLRPTPVPGESYRIFWTQNGQRRFDGQFEFTMAREQARGNWVVNVEFVTEMVRRDPQNLLRFSQSFTI